MGSTMTDLELLRLDVETLFVMSTRERIERVNDPEHSIGPKLFFAGCAEGNLARVRHDIDDATTAKLLAIAAEEPPWRDPWTLPQCIGKLLDVFSNSAPPAVGPASWIPMTVGTGVIYELPHHVKHQHPAKIVRGDSSEGADLVAHFREKGMPPAMIDAGFKSVADLWLPWCLAMEGDEVAAAAYAARLGSNGAEIGVYTFPNFRSRGYAAAVTSAWSSLPSLDDHALFYSTSRVNRSSQRVAARLGLRLFAASFSIG
jgi:hypothetical protein